MPTVNGARQSRAARADGETLQTIADAAGVSHVRVIQVLARRLAPAGSRGDQPSADPFGDRDGDGVTQGGVAAAVGGVVGYACPVVGEALEAFALDRGQTADRTCADQRQRLRL